MSTRTRQRFPYRVARRRELATATYSNFATEEEAIRDALYGTPAWWLPESPIKSIHVQLWQGRGLSFKTLGRITRGTQGDLNHTGILKHPVFTTTEAPASGTRVHSTKPLTKQRNSTMGNAFSDAFTAAKKAKPAKKTNRGPNMKDKVAEAVQAFVEAEFEGLDFISEATATKMLNRAWKVFHVGNMPGLLPDAEPEAAPSGETVDIPAETVLKKWSEVKLKKLYKTLYGKGMKGQPKKETLIAKIMACVEEE